MHQATKTVAGAAQINACFGPLAHARRTIVLGRSKSFGNRYLSYIKFVGRHPYHVSCHLETGHIANAVSVFVGTLAMFLAI